MAVKQNFVDGLVFALVLLVADGLRGERTWPDVVRRLVAGGAGVLGGVAVMVAYALTTGAGVAGLWSLPVRVLDPDLEELTALLDSDDAPTWLIQVFSFHAWGLEPGHRIESVITDRYEVVQDDWGTRIYKLRSVHRSVAPAPAC